MSDQIVVDRRVESISANGLPRRVPLPAVAQTLWSVFGMDSFVRFCLVRYPAERMLSFRIVGVGYVVSVLDPQLVREVFSGDGEVLRGGEANAQALGMLGPNSLLVLDGEPHLRARRLLLPPFHGEAIAHHARLVEQITAAEIEYWPIGEEFALWPRMRAITMKVILRAVIGVQDERRQRRLPLNSSCPRSSTPACSGRSPRLRAAVEARAARIGDRLPWVKRAGTRGTALAHEEIRRALDLPRRCRGHPGPPRLRPRGGRPRAKRPGAAPPTCSPWWAPGHDCDRGSARMVASSACCATPTCSRAAARQAPRRTRSTSPPSSTRPYGCVPWWTQCHAS